jgi:type IV secretory pathway VirB10-like protein
MNRIVGRIVEAAMLAKFIPIAGLIVAAAIVIAVYSFVIGGLRRASNAMTTPATVNTANINAAATPQGLPPAPAGNPGGAPGAAPPPGASPAAPQGPAAPADAPKPNPVEDAPLHRNPAPPAPLGREVQ